MAARYRILATGGDRAVLIGLARALQAAGATFAATADAERLLEASGRFAPHLILVFAHPSPEEAMRRVRAIRGDARFEATPILLVASLPPTDTRGVTRVVPDPSDVGDFAGRLVRFLESTELQGMQAPPAAAAEIEEIAEAEVEEITSLSARILLVDDDPVLLRLFSVLMKKSGFEVLSAADGVEGLEVALQSRPDLVIADLNMPRLDGWGLLRALRADYRVAETPLVFLSCHDDYRESLKALSAGAQDYVAKGGRLEALVARIRALLAPRDAFLGAAMARERVMAKVQEVGVQWALRHLAEARIDGVMHMRDPFWTLQVGILGGELVAANAIVGQHRLEGPAALPALVVLRQGDLIFDPGSAPMAQNLRGSVAELLEQAAARNNASEREALDRLLTQASRIEIDEQLYALYEQLGPPGSRDIAELVRGGLTPREIIARSDRSPMEIEDTLRDLVRRRVVLLSA